MSTLVIQSFGTQIDWVKQTYNESEEIQMFVKNHHMSQAIFRTFSRFAVIERYLVSFMKYQFMSCFT